VAAGVELAAAATSSPFSFELDGAASRPPFSFFHSDTLRGMANTVRRDTLVSYLDQFLDSRGRDYGPNGLQVEGKDEIGKVVTGVSACQELFVRAREAGADAVLVHHGLFWEGMPRTLTGLQFRRVAELIRGEMSLLAYHLPLDRHMEVGNNALAGRELGLRRVEPFGQYDGLPLGVKGLFPEAISPAELVERCRRVYAQEPLAYLAGPATISTLGIISGGGQRELYTAIEEGLDAYVTGEVTEWVMNVARETGIHYIAAGHYATERLGVRALGEHLVERFQIDVEFIDVPNPA
jgi:dinuclear metal center YbgI/SA1388 family protein